MIFKQYKFEQYSITKDDLIYSINIRDLKKSSPNQINLFSLMLNYGYTSYPSDDVIFTDNQIVDFWNYGKKNVLKNMDINTYYSNFGIAPVFTTKIPTLKTNGAFFSDKYEIIVTWKNDESVVKIASSPQSYTRRGLELFSIENEIKGSIAPEYFYLYKIVDNANTKWAKMTKGEKYNFLVELSTLSENTKFEMPSTLVSTLTDLQ